VKMRVSTNAARGLTGVAVTLAGIAVTVALGAEPELRTLHPREPQAGDFLIASRRLDDANFAETVVLLLHHGVDGAQGVVINRRTPVRVAAALPAVEAFASRPDTLYWGGPMEPQSAILLVRLAEAPPQAVPIVDEVWAVRTREAMDELLRRSPLPTSLRVFSGYAGWAGGQLEWEISNGSWHVRRGDQARIFQDDVERLWETLQKLASAPIA
jgi:putative transcriptional regulator